MELVRAVAGEAVAAFVVRAEDVVLVATRLVVTSVEVTVLTEVSEAVVTVTEGECEVPAVCGPADETTTAAAAVVVAVEEAEAEGAELTGADIAFSCDFSFWLEDACLVGGGGESTMYTASSSSSSTAATVGGGLGTVVAAAKVLDGLCTVDAAVDVTAPATDEDVLNAELDTDAEAVAAVEVVVVLVTVVEGTLSKETTVGDELVVAVAASLGVDDNSDVATLLVMAAILGAAILGAPVVAGLGTRMMSGPSREPDRGDAVELGAACRMMMGPPPRVADITGIGWPRLAKLRPMVDSNTRVVPACVVLPSPP